jgi:hypothetical protein
MRYEISGTIMQTVTIDLAPAASAAGAGWQTGTPAATSA